MTKKTIIKKQHVKLILLMAVILVALTVFRSELFPALIHTTNKFHNCIATDGTVFQTTEDCEIYKTDKRKERIAICNSQEQQIQYEFEFNDKKHTITEEKTLNSLGLYLGGSDYYKETFNNSDEVSKKFFSETLNKIVYLTSPENTYQENYVKEIKVYDVDSKILETIFSLKTTVKDTNSDIADITTIHSISLSPDQQKVLIITDTEIFMYDLLSKEFVFSDQPKLDKRFLNESGSFITYLNESKHYFKNGILSPNNKFAVLSQSYWETSTYFLYDLSTKNITPLNLESGNAWSGQAVIYLSDTKIVYREKTENGFSICSETFDKNQKECVELPNTEYQDGDLVITKDAAYLTFISYDPEKTYTFCNSGYDMRQKSYQYKDLYKISLDDFSVSKVLTVDISILKYQSENNRSLSPVMGYMLNGKNGILVSVTDKDNKRKYAFLDPEVPQKLTEIRL